MAVDRAFVLISLYGIQVYLQGWGCCGFGAINGGTRCEGRTERKQISRDILSGAATAYFDVRSDLSLFVGLLRVREAFSELAAI